MKKSTKGLCVLVLALVLTPDLSSALPDLLAPFRSMFGMGSKSSSSSSSSNRPFSSKSPFGGPPGGAQASPEEEEGGGFGPFKGFGDHPGGPESSHNSHPSPPPGIPYSHQLQSPRSQFNSHHQSHSAPGGSHSQRPQHSSGGGSLPVRSQHSPGSNPRPVRQQPGGGFAGHGGQSFRGNGPYGRPHGGGGGGPSLGAPPHSPENADDDFSSGGPSLPAGFTEGQLPGGGKFSNGPGGSEGPRGRPEFGPGGSERPRGRPEFGPGGSDGPRGRPEPSFGPNGPSEEQGGGGGYQPERDSPGPYPNGPPGGHPASFDDGPSSYSSEGGRGPGGPPSFSSEGGRGPPSYSSEGGRGPGGPPTSTESYGFGPFGGGPSEENDAPGGGLQPFRAASPGGPGGNRKPFKPSRPLPNFDLSQGNSRFPPGGPSDYPEQFEGGPRDTRQPPEVITADDVSKYPPQISEDDEEQRGGPGGPPPGFGNFGGFGGGPSSSPSGEDENGGPGSSQLSPFSSRPTPYRGAGGPPQQQRFGGGRPGGNVPRYRPAGNSPYAYRARAPNPMMMSGSGPVASRRPTRNQQRKHPHHTKRSGQSGIVTLESPKDPNYMASNNNPVFDEPNAAATDHGHEGLEGLSNNGDRILYHVGGHQGPHSYRFGYDTGKGSYNRLFRFEEKDGKGYVKGKYGFYDKHGKLNVVNYEAHPKHGFQAERGHTHGHYKK